MKKMKNGLKENLLTFFRKFFRVLFVCVICAATTFTFYRFGVVDTPEQLLETLVNSRESLGWTFLAGLFWAKFVLTIISVGYTTILPAGVYGTSFLSGNYTFILFLSLFVKKIIHFLSSYLVTTKIDFVLLLFRRRVWSYFW